jgi:SAM-dependent methyltransferase
MTARPFDPAGFWRTRLADSAADLNDVGHRRLGVEYNAFIYRRREEVLEQILPSLGIELGVAKILEVGCGSGYWVKWWEELGVDDLVGFDLSLPQIHQLRTWFPDYRFVQGDITTAPRDMLLERRFDILTLFDVLYHIVDDDKACRVLKTMSSVMDDRSVLLVFDQVVHSDVSLRAHVKFRGRSTFQRLLGEAGLGIRTEVPLFVWLAPPVFDRWSLNLAVHSGYAAVGMAMRRSRRLGAWLGRSISDLDRFLLRRGTRTPNSSLLVLVKE